MLRQSACNDGAVLQKKSANQQDDDEWAKSKRLKTNPGQATERTAVDLWPATGVEPREALSSQGRGKEQQDNPTRIVQAVTMLRGDDLDRRSKET